MGGSSRPLEIHDWVPRAVAAVAQTLYLEAIVRPTDAFGAYTNALRCVATDERMREVWKEINRRGGGLAQAGQYAHPARPKNVRDCLHFRTVEHLSQQPDERDRVQEQAAAILFLVVTGFFIRDRRFGIGPRTRTQVEANLAAKALDELAASNENDARRYDDLGYQQKAHILRELAADSRSQANLRRPDPRDPWIVERKSSRFGDNWDRGLIIEITQTCRFLFGTQLLGTAATLSNVALGRDDITKGTVQGVVKHVR
jgi:hypothetical protein